MILDTNDWLNVNEGLKQLIRIKYSKYKYYKNFRFAMKLKYKYI